MSDLEARLAAALGARYRLEGELGSGGMATVYLAEDLKHGRPVAVKVLRPDLTATLGAERFLREIRIAARLSHPHIVPLIDSGESDGLLWFVSPYVAGGSLRARLEKGGRLAAAEALRLTREVGMGLDYVHRNGFVHRDIKPENILFADDHAVLADFGIARACCGPGATNVTEIGLALGTPAYMSPEAAAGEADPQSPSDVYSLACVLLANVDAYALYLRGRHAWNRRTQAGVAEGIRCFEQAIAIDPSYAPAYTGLADCWALHVDYRSVPVHEGFRKAKAYARKALELDHTLAEAHASLAWSLFIYDWDWTGARQAFERAVALEPRYATAHQWYAFLLVSQGQGAEALVEGHTAQELDPASISIRRGLGYLYYYTRRWEQARYHAIRTIAMNPEAEESHRVLGLILAEMGRLEEAEQDGVRHRPPRNGRAGTGAGLDRAGHGGTPRLAGLSRRAPDSGSCAGGAAIQGVAGTDAAGLILARAGSAGWR